MPLFKEEKAGVKVMKGVNAWVALNPLIWILWLLDFTIWLVYFLVIGWVFALCRCLGKRPYSSTHEADGHVDRRAGYLDTNDLVKGPREGTTTAWECFEYAFKAYAQNKCMGTRRYLGEWKKNPQHKMVKKIFGSTDWATYGDVHKRALSFGRGLVRLGMTPSKAMNKTEFEASDAPDTLLLWEDTSAQWMTCAAGAFSQSLVVATSYSTLGVEGVMESMKECDCPVLVCNRSKVKELVDVLTEAGQGKLTTVIYTDNQCGGSEAFGFEDPKDEESSKLDLSHFEDKVAPLPDLATEMKEKGTPFADGIKVINFEDVIKLGDEGESTKIVQSPPKPNTMAVVMYTSGSTGKPKGVLIAHKNLCASVGGMAANFRTWGTEGAETYMAYLPAAHILELVAEIGMLSFGATLGYGDPRTITSQGACRFHVDAAGKKRLQFDPSLALAPGSIQEFKPSCMAGVPKVWDIIKKGIDEKFDNQSAVVRCIYEAAFAACLNAQSWRSCPLLGLLFSKGIGGVLGGNMKVGISGGGAISNETQGFCRVAFGFPLIQGYALTETCCAGTVQLTHDFENGVVGPPISSVEIRLVSEPDVNDRKGKPYLDTDTQHWDGSPCIGRGQVYIRGPSVSLGYYAKYGEAKKMTKKTEEEFCSATPNDKQDEYDWFKTGDIGLLTPDGRLKLVDRKKNLVKLAGGEYIAIEQMESIYAGSKFVDAKRGGMMVHGDHEMDKPVAIFQADINHLLKVASGLNIAETDPDKLCQDEKIIKAAVADMAKIHGDGGLAINEKICAVGLISGTGNAEFPGDVRSPWTPENGFLTASNKLDRNAIAHGKTMNGVTSPSFDEIIQPLRKKAGAKGDGKR